MVISLLLVAAAYLLAAAAIGLLSAFVDAFNFGRQASWYEHAIIGLLWPVVAVVGIAMRFKR